MSKLKFGNDSVVPVKDLRNPYNAGTGINADLLREGTIQVESNVLRNLSPNFSPISGGSLRVTGTVNPSSEPFFTTSIGITSGANANNSVALGYKSRSYGEKSITIGSKASTASTNAVTGSIVMGYEAYSDKSNSVVIGREAQSTNESSIVIGSEANSGDAYGAIVIGANSKGSTSSSNNSSIIIGNNIDESNMDSPRTVIIGGMDNSVTSANRLKAYRDSVVVGYNAGSYGSGTPCYNVVIGSSASSKYYYSIAIGPHACAYSGGGIAIGSWAKTALGTDGSSSSSGIPSSTDISIGGDSFAYGTGNVSMGYSAGTCGWDNLAIGAWARVGTTSASRTNSIAIGNNAKVYGDRAIQIGPGTNNDSDSIQIGNTKLVKSDGTIPYQRLTTYVPIDGQVLFYDEDNDCLGWKDAGQSGGGTYTLPVASRTTLGGVKVGSGLNVTSEGTLSVAFQKTSWGTIDGTLSNQTDLQNALDAKQGIMQYTNMPNASSRYNNKVAQYIGTETDLYKPGQFYQCTLDSYPTVECTSDIIWGKLTTDAWMFANFVSKYFYNNDLGSVPSKTYEIEYVNQYDGYGWILYENETSVYVKDIYKMGIDAEGGEPGVGDKIYVQLYMHATSAYAWRKLLVDAQVSVNNTLTSTSTKQALSANQGRVLNDKIKELSGISNFLAMWDTDTGIARYLDVGYVYHSGDYFIIAETDSSRCSGTCDGQYAESPFTVNVDDFESYMQPTESGTYTVVYVASDTAWYCDGQEVDTQSMGVPDIYHESHHSPEDGDTMIITYHKKIDYKPAGAMYPGDTPTSREVTDDPVQISDMYFYDGAHWIFLPSSSRQIAVDEYLDDTSRNPVENRVVTNALNDKVDASLTEGIYATDDGGNTVKLSYGAGLEVDNGELQNKPVYGNFTGNIEDQTDLVEYISQHGGGSGGGSPVQLADVFVRNKNLLSKNGVSESEQYRYKYDYRDIFFRMSGDYDTLKSMQDDVYVTVAHNSIANDARNTHKITPYNDCNRFKTNKKFYCWRSTSRNETYYYNSDDGNWDWYQGQPRHTEYVYFYVEDEYQNSQDLETSDPTIFNVVPCYDEWESLYPGCWGTSFNELYQYGPLSDFDEGSYERCPQYDIDTVISLNSNFDGSSQSSHYQLGNVVKNNMSKMYCRVYNLPTGKAFLWCNDWTASGEDVYAYLDENDYPQYKVPNFMGDLEIYDTTENIPDTFIEKRNDLNYYYYGGSTSNFRNVVRDLTRSTQDFPVRDDRVHLINWNSYWLDYPIRPIRLSECKIYAYMTPPSHGDHSLHLKYISFLGQAWSFDEIEADEDLKTLIMNQDDLLFVLPYDTAYIWLRTFGWQKMVYCYWEDGVTAYPWERHDLKDAVQKSTNNSWLGTFQMGRLYGYRHANSFNSSSNKFYQRIEFNTIMAKDLSNNRLTGTLTPISRKLWISAAGSQGMTQQ